VVWPRAWFQEWLVFEEEEAFLGIASAGTCVDPVRAFAVHPVELERFGLVVPFLW